MKSTDKVTKDQTLPDFMTDLTSRSRRHIIQQKKTARETARRHEDAMKYGGAGICINPDAHSR